MKRNTIRVFVCVMVLFAAAGAYAQRTASCICGGPAQLPAQWVIRHSDPNAQAAAFDAFSAWNLYADAFRATASAGESVEENGINEIAFYDFSSVPGLDPDTIVGFAPSDPFDSFGTPRFNQCPIPAGTACGTFTESEVWLNEKAPWNVDRPNIDRPGFVAFYASTAVHEIGHTLGFHHNFSNVSTMNYYHDFAGYYVSQSDVHALRARYPDRAKSVTDIATYPFTYNSDSQTGSSDGDGAVTSATVSPSNVAPGGKVVVKNWTIENLSTGSSNPALLLFFLSTDQNITTGDIYLGGFRWNPLGTNEYGQDTDGHEFTIPANVPAGRYYLGAIAGLGASANEFQADGIAYNNSWVIPSAINVGSSSPGTPSICTPNDTTLCLVNRRFSVQVSWNDGASQRGQGHALSYTDASGFFWFSSNDNIEILLKVLDACSFAKRIWVFGAAATTLAYDITVTDNKTGQTKVYHHDNGTPATAIADTQAFATCQ